MLFGMLSLSPARVVCSFVVRMEASDTSLGSAQLRKQYDYERVRCAETIESGSSLRSMSFRLLAGSQERKTYVEEKRSVSRRPEG